MIYERRLYRKDNEAMQHRSDNKKAKREDKER